MPVQVTEAHLAEPITYSHGDRWTVDDDGHLHVIAGGERSRTVATHAAGTWVSARRA